MNKIFIEFIYKYKYYNYYHVITKNYNKTVIHANIVISLFNEN